ncbi:hypothetical protein S23_01570 [Bradyrhizobium cosmicum]|uniref:Uncharacterized protein n=1 Tax=Bradyrhizobium cosmicum TaxID=1404864 RepID=A0AAI8M8L3_9BRAD|nr:hypothetical protein FNV92_13215 [Bradyrhizobium cosmicum]BAL73383.1 hypothetical protein S23_01570 [Bradyrhizobium cosmicum]
MRTAWTQHASPASPLAGEAVVSGSTGQGSVAIGPVTIDQFPAVMLNAAKQPSAATRSAAYIKAACIVARRHRFAPT